jgi:hypothetical protein
MRRSGVGCLAEEAPPGEAERIWAAMAAVLREDGRELEADAVVAWVRLILTASNCRVISCTFCLVKTEGCFGGGLGLMGRGMVLFLQGCCLKISTFNREHKKLCCHHLQNLYRLTNN